MVHALGLILKTSEEDCNVWQLGHHLVSHMRSVRMESHHRAIGSVILWSYNLW